MTDVTYRILPFEEWSKLQPILDVEQPGYILPSPEMAYIAVAELEGKVIAFWILQLLPHLEPCCVDPQVPHIVSLRKLRQTLFDALEGPGGMSYYINVTDSRLAGILEREGLVPIGFTYAGKTTKEGGN